ncbi:DUF6503 family protein [Polaribacter sargassicola]|uniref:DUF6503 family protein n=1 Tax=Polaribacter sargassicola TaxID=2836891 RepID=UPI001F425367|nr:DUF6503 family protein [Polaribacter sp. DS7-9]MCG1036900.1 deoxyribose-phosphate aldolase [Polaribacter sp. DS7-9]
MKYLSVVFFLLIISCKPTQKNYTAQEIIDKSIAASGSDKIANAELKFIFRDKEYIANRKADGSFKLTKKYKDEKVGFVSDILSNKGFKKLINGTPYQLKDSLANIASNAVNSVHYFSVLPYGLNDKAVKKKLLPSVTIKGEEYYKVEVTFSEDGGGEDFEDVFIYWIRKKDFLMDYLAYSYHTNGGGKRFRAINKEVIKNGIRFVNYDNYKPLNDSIPLIDIDKAFEENQLKKLSEINLEEIEVTIL